MGKLWIGYSNGCWIDVFDAPQFQGRRCRLVGPGEFRLLRIGEEGWGNHVGSLIVGPAAYIQCFEDEFAAAESYWLIPGQKVASIDSLEFTEDYDSLRVFDRPPFGSEPGYIAYLKCAGIATIEEPATAAQKKALRPHAHPRKR